MITFVDPRTDPAACATTPRLTEDAAKIADLHHLCRDGRLYDVERWIEAGRPLQLADGAAVNGRRITSALEIALEAKNHALVLLLLCNGYDPNGEAGCPLDLALRARRWDLLDLLLEWGADVQRASLYELFATYNSALWERFRTLGVDLTAGHELAEALAYHTSNKPLFGFAKRHREDDQAIQKELNMALLHHAEEGNEKGVQLCLWAGADPHAHVPSLSYPTDIDDDENADEDDRFLGWTAVEEACSRGEVKILERLGPDPGRDDFDKLFERAANQYVVQFLARLALPKNIGAVVRTQFFWMEDKPFCRPRSVDTVEPLFQAGARWQTSSADEIASVRRSLLHFSKYDFEKAMKLLAAQDYCSATILHELGRTSAVRARMREVGFIPLPETDDRRFYQVRPTRSREVLAKFGIELRKIRDLQKPKRQPPTCIYIGSRAEGRELRLDRAALFERVWSEPVEKLANAWGLSGRGLAKVCQRLQIPVPPRGYWARVRTGQSVRRPKLRKASDQPNEIVVRVPT